MELMTRTSTDVPAIATGCPFLLLQHMSKLIDRAVSAGRRLVECWGKHICIGRVREQPFQQLGRRRSSSTVMGSIRSWLLFAALLSLSVNAGVNGQDDVEDHDDFFDIVEKAFLLVRHKIDTVELVQGKNTSVVVEIYNAGNRCQLQHLNQLVFAACCS